MNLALSSLAQMGGAYPLAYTIYGECVSRVNPPLTRLRICTN